MNRGINGSSRSMHAAAMVTTAAHGIATEVADPAESRRKLEALFGGQGKPANNQGPTLARNFANSNRRAGRGRLSERAMLLNLTRESMRDAIARNDDAAFERGAEKFLATHELPDDADFLCKMLHHPSNKVLCNVLGHISALLLQRRLVASLAIVEISVADVARRETLSDAVRCCVRGLLDQIKKLRDN